MSETGTAIEFRTGADVQKYPMNALQEIRRLQTEVKALTSQPHSAFIALLAQNRELVEALTLIIGNSDESNEWDAVDKLRKNEETARSAIAKLGKV